MMQDKVIIFLQENTEKLYTCSSYNESAEI